MRLEGQHPLPRTEEWGSDSGAGGWGGWERGTVSRAAQRRGRGEKGEDRPKGLWGLDPGDH